MPTESSFRLSLYLTLALACVAIGYAEASFLFEAPIVAGLVIASLAVLYWLETRVELLTIPAANRLGLLLGLANIVWAFFRVLSELNDPQTAQHRLAGARAGNDRPTGHDADARETGPAREACGRLLVVARPGPGCRGARGGDGRGSPHLRLDRGLRRMCDLEPRGILAAPLRRHHQPHPGTRTGGPRRRGHRGRAGVPRPSGSLSPWPESPSWPQYRYTSSRRGRVSPSWSSASHGSRSGSRRIRWWT